MLESRPFLSRVPDQTLIKPAYYPETDYVVATLGDGYAFVYIPTGWPVDIILDKIGAKTITAYWFDPRTGNSSLSGTFEGKGTKNFIPPSSGMGNDWILVLDDTSRNFGLPGAVISR